MLVDHLRQVNRVPSPRGQRSPLSIGSGPDGQVDAREITAHDHWPVLHPAGDLGFPRPNKRATRPRTPSNASVTAAATTVLPARAARAVTSTVAPQSKDDPARGAAQANATVAASGGMATLRGGRGRRAAGPGYGSPAATVREHAGRPSAGKG
jgi:hypothetical protein